MSQQHIGVYQRISQMTTDVDCSISLIWLSCRNFQFRISKHLIGPVLTFRLSLRLPRLCLSFHFLNNSRSYITSLPFHMTLTDVEEGHVPWGKYRYVLEGLATGCYIENTVETLARAQYPAFCSKKKLRFRVELPSRCFVISVTVKLPNASEAALVALQDVIIERSLGNGEYELAYDGYAENIKKNMNRFDDESSTAIDGASDAQENTSAIQFPDEVKESPTPVDRADHDLSKSHCKLTRKKVMELKRAADSLRITIADIEEENDIKLFSHGPDMTMESADGSDRDDFCILGVVVLGYIRGQTPSSNRIKILLNSPFTHGFQFSKADRAEVSALLGLAFLGIHRCRQAAEFFHHASELVKELAVENADAGYTTEDTIDWATELSLLSAHAFFADTPKSNDGLCRLIDVSHSVKSKRVGASFIENPCLTVSDFLDFRTTLLNIFEDLVTVLVRFLVDSSSVVVKMASAQFIEFLHEQLGCVMVKHVSSILDQVLRSYPKCIVFGARQRTFASSFSYDSIEDCFDCLVDICCRIFPQIECNTLRGIYEDTLLPIFLEGYRESDYLSFIGNPDEEIDDLIIAAVSQTLRTIYLASIILGSDAPVCSDLIVRLLNILITENGIPRTPLLLRRAALHSWDAISGAIIKAANGGNLNTWVGHLVVLRDYIPKLLLTLPRSDFSYSTMEDEGGEKVENVDEEEFIVGCADAFDVLVQKRKTRTVIVDRHTLRRLLCVIHGICTAVTPIKEDDEVSITTMLSAIETIGCSIADLLLSGLIDVSYHVATVSGNGQEGENNRYEYGGINTQISIICEVIDEMFDCYWCATGLLPHESAAHGVQAVSIRMVLAWCVDRMKKRAPPRGMLRFLFVTVKGLHNERNTPMHELFCAAKAIHDITFLEIYRSHLMWFPQSVYEESFEFMDLLTEIVAEDITAKDLFLLIQALGNQTGQQQSRTEASMHLLASIVASKAPRRPLVMLSSLKALSDPNLSKQRIANGFPNTTRLGAVSTYQRHAEAPLTEQPDAIYTSLYLHVVLASCFDQFDGLAYAASKRMGPNCMRVKIDSFVEHAALSVRCLHACAGVRSHREYVGAVIGDIFGTCLAMQDHGDGRVRLAGFEVFGASLDVLFLAERIVDRVVEDPFASNCICNDVRETESRDLPLRTEGKTTMKAVNPSSREGSNGLLPSDFAATCTRTCEQLAMKGGYDNDNTRAKLDFQMRGMSCEGGVCLFQGEDTSLSDLVYEERGWQILCAFIASSLGVGKYVDFVVQRATLEYLKACLVNSLLGRCSGVSVIGFEHIEVLWDAVNRLVGSPWRTLNDLSCWIICTILNMAIYSSSMAQGRGVARHRATQFHDFATTQVFPTIENFLSHGGRETRLWGMKLLEVYVKAQDLNNSVMYTVPVPPSHVIRAVDMLKHDWNEDIQHRVCLLLETHYRTLKKKGRPHINIPFTVQAQNFMSMKRHQNEDVEASDLTGVHLWFPSVPKPLSSLELQIFCRSLEAFANSEVEGGEEADIGLGEINVVGDNEESDGPGYEDDDEFYQHQDNGVPEKCEKEESGLRSLLIENAGECNPVHDHCESIERDMKQDGEGRIPQKDIMDQVRSSSESFMCSLENESENLNVKQKEENGKEFQTESEDTRERLFVSTWNPSCLTNLAFAKDEIVPPVDDMNDVDDYDVEDDDVVNVTDEDDVLVDLDPISTKRSLSSSASGNEETVSKIPISRRIMGKSTELKTQQHLLTRKVPFSSQRALHVSSDQEALLKLSRRQCVPSGSIFSTHDITPDNQLEILAGEESSLPVPTTSEPEQHGDKLFLSHSGKFLCSPGLKNVHSDEDSVWRDKIEDIRDKKLSLSTPPLRGHRYQNVLGSSKGFTGSDVCFEGMRPTCCKKDNSPLAETSGMPQRPNCFQKTPGNIMGETLKHRIPPHMGFPTSSSDKSAARFEPRMIPSSSKIVRSRLPRAPAFVKSGATRRIDSVSLQEKCISTQDATIIQPQEALKCNKDGDAAEAFRSEQGISNFIRNDNRKVISLHEHNELKGVDNSKSQRQRRFSRREPTRFRSPDCNVLEEDMH